MTQDKGRIYQENPIYNVCMHGYACQGNNNITRSNGSSGKKGLNLCVLYFENPEK